MPWPALKKLECTILGKGWGAALGDFISGLALTSLEITYGGFYCKDREILDLLERMANNANLPKLLELKVDLHYLSPSPSTEAQQVKNAIVAHAAAIFKKTSSLRKLILLGNYINLDCSLELFSSGCMHDLTELHIGGGFNKDQSLRQPLSLPSWPKLQDLTLFDSLSAGFGAITNQTWFTQLTSLDLHIYDELLPLEILNKAVNLKSLRLAYHGQTEPCIHRCRNSALTHLLLYKEEFPDPYRHSSESDEAVIPLNLSNFPALVCLECYRSLEYEEYNNVPRVCRVLDFSEPPASHSKLNCVSLDDFFCTGLNVVQIATRWVPKLREFEVKDQRARIMIALLSTLKNTNAKDGPMWPNLEIFEMDFYEEDPPEGSPDPLTGIEIMRTLIDGAGHMPQLRMLRIEFIEVSYRPCLEAITEAVQRRVWPRLESATFGAIFPDGRVKIPMWPPASLMMD